LQHPARDNRATTPLRFPLRGLIGPGRRHVAAIHTSDFVSRRCRAVFPPVNPRRAAPDDVRARELARAPPRVQPRAAGRILTDVTVADGALFP